MKASKSIMVAGFPCGGTSCVAGIFHNAGVDMGKGAQVEGAMYHDGWIAYPENPKGQYEDDESVLLSRHILQGHWFYPRVPDVLTQEQEARMDALIKKRCESSLWGVKAPSLAFTGPFFLKKMLDYSDPKLVLVVRDEYVVVEHVCKRFGEVGVGPVGSFSFVGEAARALNRLGTVALSLKIPLHVVKYENIVADPKGAVTELLDNVFRDWSWGTLEQYQKAIAFVDPSLNHAN